MNIIFWEKIFDHTNSNFPSIHRLWFFFFSKNIPVQVQDHSFFFFFNLFVYLFYFTILYWFCHTLTWILHRCTCVLHPETPSHLHTHPIPLGHQSVPALSSLSHALSLGWQFISHMIIYMFQCHSPISSCPRPLPQNPKDCSIHLCLFCCLAHRVIVTIFLNFIYIYMCVCVCVCVCVC